MLDCTPEFAEDPDCKEKAKKLRQAFDTIGITVHQTHAPFNRYKKEPVEVFKEKLTRSFETSEILGAKYVVVHGDEYENDENYDSDAACKAAYELYAPYVEFAEKKNMSVAFENVFEDRAGRGIPISRCCSRTEELIQIIDSFGSKAASCCWDFGHANVAFGKDKMLDELKKVGARLSCTHVHDNYYGSDLHLPPFFGEIDWKIYDRIILEAINKRALAKTSTLVYNLLRKVLGNEVPIALS